MLVWPRKMDTLSCAVFPGGCHSGGGGVSSRRHVAGQDTRGGARLVSLYRLVAPEGMHVGYGVT